jgi:antirestriction protein
MKIVINKCFGGFGLSNKGIEKYYTLQGMSCYFYKQTKYEYRDGVDEYTKVSTDNTDILTHTVSKDLGDITTGSLLNDHYLSCWDIERDNKFLVEVVETLGEEANGTCAELEIVDIPDDTNWHIEEYDGMEHIAEHHRTWE